MWKFHFDVTPHSELDGLFDHVEIIIQKSDLEIHRLESDIRSTLSTMMNRHAQFIEIC